MILQLLGLLFCQTNNPIRVKEIDVQELVNVVAKSQPSDRSGTWLIIVLTAGLIISAVLNWILIKELLRKSAAISVDNLKEVAQIFKDK